MTGITEADMLRMELRASCSQDVNKLLFEYVGADALNTATEHALLNHIKSVAVKGTHKEVHRLKFFRLHQMDGETITQFVARLRSHAVLCQFKVACPNHDQPTFINFADEMITQQLVSGLKNQQHQSRILSEAEALPSLREKIERLQCLESTEHSTDIMRSDPPTASMSAPVKSHYKREQRNQVRGANQSTNDPHPCKGCGRTSHDGKSMARSNCPAINKICLNCGIKGHFRAVCQKKPSGNPSRSNAVMTGNGQEISQLPQTDPNVEEGSFAFTASEDFRLAPNQIGQP